MDNLIHAALPISEDIELKETPSTGEEFLLKVIEERKKCPETVYVKPPLKTLQNIFIQEPPSAASAPPNLKPTIEWQNVQLSDFYAMRIHTIRLSQQRLLMQSPKLPDIDEIELDDEFIKRNQPGLRLMLAFKQHHLDLCLEIILKILDRVEPGEGINDFIGVWIYSILICQSNPVLSETSCLLRNLARMCAQIRSHLNINEEHSADLATPLNLFICIVSRYYRELDLADS